MPLRILFGQVLHIVKEGLHRFLEQQGRNPMQYSELHLHYFDMGKYAVFLRWLHFTTLI